MELSAEQQEAIKQQKEQCPFCQILAGKIPAKKVWEDDKLLAILDINPANPGHLLLLPKEHYPIMPLIPEDVFTHLFEVVPQVAAQLRKAMVAKHCSVFIASGAAAGQQSSHFMVHLIPSDKPLGNFQLPSGSLDSGQFQEAGQMLANNLPLMMRDRSKLFVLDKDVAAPPDEATKRLAEMIEENPEFKRMLMENPDAVLAGLEDNPSLKPLFEGVDVHELAARLKEQEEGLQIPVEEVSEPAPPSPDPTPEPDDSPAEALPRAADLSDQALRDFVAGKEKLRDFLFNDIETLKLAVQQQERLQHFFEGTSPEQVLARLRNEESSDSSLEDLAGGSS